MAIVVADAAPDATTPTLAYCFSGSIRSKHDDRNM